jgi:probable HAF family extracellular repeat protein
MKRLKRTERWRSPCGKEFRGRPLLLEQLEERCVWSYSITDLGTLPGGCTSDGYAVNVNGLVTGSSDITGCSVSPGIAHPFLWDPNHVPPMQDLGTLGGTSGSSSGYAINNKTNPQVAGVAQTSGGAMHGFVYDGANMVDVGVLPGGGSQSSMRGLNSNANEVAVGESDAGAQQLGAVHAVTWDPVNHLQDLGTVLGGLRSFAYALDDASPPHIVGQSQGTAFNQVCGIETIIHFHAVLWHGSDMILDLGTLDGNKFESHAFGINAGGEAVGDSSDSTGEPCGRYPPHAVSFQNGSVTRLDLDPGAVGIGQSRALGVNVSGVIVGIAGTGNTGMLPFVQQRAILYDPAGGTPHWHNLVDLLPAGSGWQLQEANGINGSGQIVGRGICCSGPGNQPLTQHAFLMTPTAGPSGSGGGDRQLDVPMADSLAAQGQSTFAAPTNSLVSPAPAGSATAQPTVMEVSTGDQAAAALAPKAPAVLQSPPREPLATMAGSPVAELKINWSAGLLG